MYQLMYTSGVSGDKIETMNVACVVNGALLQLLTTTSVNRQVTISLLRIETCQNDVPGTLGPITVVVL